ncbi:DUF488 domain-containing protein [Janthinobacterium sp. EB271-G4-7A]|jgi:uncharacterized protein (DUF488 family)|uniref:DUF488 domain-containing protein n=1 Tax=Janthinobacterium sp. EB271-G4-7A TaxID=2775056 RepID=UPI001E2C9151|nr:DUF488 domain-containing protein [Janthinobacterium sp. EB271-G4-7A]MCC7695125.1 DUF488 domain-containing protein [Janthinobacterium sp. EB271-G4-7A]
MQTYTIGFTKKNAETFFKFLRASKIKTLIDVRLNNVSQLSGFAKKDDLRFFLKELCSAEYMHVPEMAPTKEILSPYQDGKITWAAYEEKFLNLMAQRNIERLLTPDILDNGCLLCSEHEPHMCHRRLVVEYINKNTDLNIKIKHLY